MKRILCGVALLAGLALVSASARAATFAMDTKFLTPPAGMATIGDSHGDIAVSPAGEIYVSVQGGEHPGIQVYSSKGRYLRNVPGAPPDLHGFIIARAPDRKFYIYGVSRLAQEIIQLKLDGARVLTIPASSIPMQYEKDDTQAINLTGIAVAPDGDIYVTDGYGLDYIHRFDRNGKYLATFGGKGEPWNFDQCHKIAIDTRFSPLRLLCTDRRHNRLVHMDLDGKVLGVFAQGLRLPSALAIYKDELAVGELQGRVTILDRNGALVTSIGTNENPDEIRTNKAPPEIWKADRFYAPHGVTYDAKGNLLVTEFNQYGRVTRIDRK
jgi:DNA-binding beta-propeller fold protein YncE